MPRSGTPGGREEVGLGAGGDQTIYLDQLAEGIVVRHLEQAYRSGLRFHLISEELGERDFGGAGLVLADPLDGSVNAKMGLPYYAVVLAVTEGDRFRDVRLGYVQNLVTGDEFHAIEGGGAFRNGTPLQPSPAAFDGRSSLSRMLATCRSVVLRVITRSSAIWRLLKPRAILVATSTSRLVSTV